MSFFFIILSFLDCNKWKGPKIKIQEYELLLVYKQRPLVHCLATQTGNNHAGTVFLQQCLAYQLTLLIG